MDPQKTSTYVSPYQGRENQDWLNITEGLISVYPIPHQELVEIVLWSWSSIFKSTLGTFHIGLEIFPSPQIMSFFLHELVAHRIEMSYPTSFKAGKEKSEKDVECVIDPKFSFEIKASSHKKDVFANRSYAQPVTGPTLKRKDGYYLTINFEPFKDAKDREPKILLIKFGYLEHSDWIPQRSATGQNASLSPAAKAYKLKQIYP